MCFAQAAAATTKAREVTTKIHRVRAVVDARQALPTNGESARWLRVGDDHDTATGVRSTFPESSRLYASSTSSEAKKYTSHLVMSGWVLPDLPVHTVTSERTPLLAL